MTFDFDDELAPPPPAPEFDWTPDGNAPHVKIIEKERKVKAEKKNEDKVKGQENK